MKPTLRQQLLTALEPFDGIELAIVFGSGAEGRERADSDIDIAIQMPRPIDTSTTIALIESIALATGRAVDLIDLRTSGEPLTGQIFKGVRLLGSDTTYGERLSRHLADVADFLPLHNRLLKERREAWINN